MGFQAQLNGGNNTFGETIMGASAGTNVTGSQNVILGYNVGSTTLTSGIENILIGFNNSTDTPTSGANKFISIAQTIINNAAAVTVSSGFGTSPAIVSTGDAAFTVTVGTGGTSTGTANTITFANAAPHGWACSANDLTTTSTSVFLQKETATTTTTATFVNYSDTATAAVMTAGDVLQFRCSGY